ncbi:hypothetical protein CK203_057395 [Vitis vinifera]|uniref:Retrotransposon gag domain-containing protein n=1 Tax=Vitis vinifera TaxID=29760 RepID=A0A438FUI0_VITVI|nr:hypothetical protein CK203_057395 [Vitis vinifera]
MHYRQLMTLDIGNDALLCKVFPSSLQGQALSWFHRLPPNSVGDFRDLSEAFVGQYLCSARHKQNISTLQNIKMQDNESLREFVKRFGQAVLQVEACSMDAVLQIFKRSICPGTPFFESLAKKPLQQWMTYSDAPTNIQCSKMTACPTSDGLDPLERTHPQGIVVGDVPSTRIMAIQQRHAELSSFWQFGRSVQASVVGHMGHSLAGLENPDESIRIQRSSTTLGTLYCRSKLAQSLSTYISVVQELSPFNVILGRTWLHYMKAIPSTYHQMVSFLTNEGQIDLYGSQLAARQCYQIAREAGANQEDASPPEPSIAHDQ